MDSSCHSCSRWGLSWGWWQTMVAMPEGYVPGNTVTSTCAELMPWPASLCYCVAWDTNAVCRNLWDYLWHTQCSQPDPYTYACINTPCYVWSVHIHYTYSSTYSMYRSESPPANSLSILHYMLYKWTQMFIWHCIMPSVVFFAKPIV